MIRTAMDPLLAELRSMDCAALGERLGLNAQELHDRLQGVVEFNVWELMVTARWLGRPMSVLFAAFDSLFSPAGKLSHGDSESLGDLT